MNSGQQRDNHKPRGARLRWMAGLGAGAAACAFLLSPVAGRAPTSLLPPGFGSAPEPDQQAEEPETQRDNSPSADPARGTGSLLQLDLSEAGVPAGNAADLIEEELTPEELAEQQEKYDLPASARRSLAKIGPLTPITGGLPEDAFGPRSGRFLAALMRETKAPLVSRWASILLRRTLLSATQTPGDIDGADWAAERAWLLVRMGEADAARMMVQSVDANRYTPRLYAVAMQAYLASADPVGLCPYYLGAKSASNSAGWRMAEAICASFSAEQGRASAVLNQAQRSGDVRGIDYRLTEKIVGAGTNARRSVKIEWDGVDQLTAWRYGLATAANVDIPAPLMARAGNHVQAWRARAPMLALQVRLPDVETATRLGVFSSAALIDFYSQIYGSDEAPPGLSDRLQAIRLAHGAGTIGDRIDAMRDLWAMRDDPDFLDMLALSRAAAVLPVADIGGDDLSNLVAAMLSAGYDRSAMRWAQGTGALSESGGADGWAMLAVGAPQQPFSIDGERVRSYAEANSAKGRMLVAGLAGLGRLRGDALSGAVEAAPLDFRPRTRWERAITLAGSRQEKGTVALLAAVGMQVSRWSAMPPEHLYHIVLALRRAGLDAEARMIAAEAIMRS